MRGLEQILWRVTVVMSITLPIAWFVLASADLIEGLAPPERWSVLAQAAYVSGFLAALAAFPWIAFYVVRWVVRGLSD